MSIRRLKTIIDSCWAQHLAFRIAFVVAFLFSLVAVSIYAFSVFRPFFGWLVRVLLAIYYTSKYRTESPARFRGKYWWLPLLLSALSMAFFFYHNYTLNQIDSLLFSATLCLISIGCTLYYSSRKETKLFGD